MKVNPQHFPEQRKRREGIEQLVDESFKGGFEEGRLWAYQEAVGIWNLIKLNKRLTNPYSDEVLTTFVEERLKRIKDFE